MKKILKIVMCILIATPTLTSCASSRGCKKMRKYRKYTHQTIKINTNQITYLS